MAAAAALADLGYAFVPGPSGDPSDWVLRQVADASKGFQWRGQDNYDQVGDAVVLQIQEMLPEVCGLEPLPLPVGAAPSCTVYGSPKLAEHEGPLLLLVCGSAPGGAAGVWGRSLCINDSLLKGAMFDYVRRAQALGWAVLVANPHTHTVGGLPVPGSETPHLHLQTLWRTYVELAAASAVLIVAHSYGGPLTVNLLKVERSAVERVRAIAFTDAVAFAGSILQERVMTAEHAAALSPGDPAAARLQRSLARFAAMTPTAFQPPPQEVVSLLANAARNWVSSALPLGALAAPDREGVPAVSSGHQSHPATTHAATEEVFAFLQQGLAGTAAASNAALRAGGR